MNKNIILLLILSTLCVVKSCLNTCIFQNDQGTYKIDLSPLKGVVHSVSKTEFDKQITYTFSLCSSTLECSTITAGAQSCQTTPNGFFETGNYNNGRYRLYNGLPGENSIHIHYNASGSQGGFNAKCPDGNYRSVNYFLKCGAETLIIDNYNEDPMCVYNFYISSKYACPV
ncbi:hypothetical protein ACTA71_004016 [Dictyostelium dimigraforme]